ncbi:conserved hypothetical protein [Escherichia phage Bp7]|uniref:Uncharacterized protein mrh.2 n=2 Tax=Caudoviricetes TaxID=2731619 RepID=G3MUF9_9CAUD|nr:hypothetical protein F392_gp127 [Escherichia phage Bp7]AEN93829.1 conserved hypothetical protein [Escherichia phage Bp7]
MLNRWIKPNNAVGALIAQEVSLKYGLGYHDDVITHSFMMYEDNSVEFNAEIRLDNGDVKFVRGFL